MAKGEEPGAALRSFLDNYPGRVFLAADSAGRREALLELLAAGDLKPGLVAGWPAFVADETTKFALAVAPLDEGFALQSPALAVLTERQLFPDRAEQSRRRRRAARDPDQILRDLSEIAIGAPIVHEDHGIGRYQGLVALDTGGVPGEFLCIEYARGDKLYVPVSQLMLVSRYSGA
jgi:transcription-repair coupling factor (superfamily II helicase)